MEKVIITIFTDPMMGLSYECEPVFRSLESHFRGKIEFRYVMGGLVRDVSDFMTPEELSYAPEEGIRRYCLRLADIYRSEESIGGLPINMDGFHLFDVQHRSSWPLNIAFEAVKLIKPEKDEQFLYRLRYETIMETRQTTCSNELIRIAGICGLDTASFIRALSDGTAETAFLADLDRRKSLGIYGLPANLIQYREKFMLVKSLIGYEEFAGLISKISDGKILSEKPEVTTAEIERILKQHPLISGMELMAAFDLNTRQIELVMASCLSGKWSKNRYGFYEMTKS